MTEATEQFCLRITTVILMKALGKYQSSERSELLLQGESLSESGCALRLPLHAGILATSPHPVPSRPSGPAASFLCIPTHSSGATKFQGRAALKQAIPGQFRAALPSFAIVEWGRPKPLQVTRMTQQGFGLGQRQERWGKDKILCSSRGRKSF